MAHIEKRGPRRYRARYRAPNGVERSRTFERRVDAERWLDRLRGDLARGWYVDPEAGRRLFRDYAASWRETQLHRDLTKAQLDSLIPRHVLPFFGDRPLGSVRPSEVQGWVKDRAEVLGPTSVEMAYRVVASVFRAAVADRLIPASPCLGIKRPSRVRHQLEEDEILTTEQVLDLAAAVPDRYRALVVVGAGAGLRNGEALGLTEARVEFLRRQLRIEEQLITAPGKEPYLGPPKTQASQRTIPVPNVVTEALASHRERFQPGPWGLVFTSELGAPIRRQNFGRMWRGAVARAGLPTGTRFHDLRHYYASLLIRYGESVKVVQSRLGHASATETLDTYSHLWPDSEERTRQAVQEALRDPLAAAASTGGVT